MVEKKVENLSDCREPESQEQEKDLTAIASLEDRDRNSMRQVTQAVSRSGERQGKAFSPRAYRSEHSPVPTL